MQSLGLNAAQVKRMNKPYEYKGFTVQRERRFTSGCGSNAFTYRFWSKIHKFTGGRASKDEVRFAIDNYLRQVDA